MGKAVFQNVFLNGSSGKTRILVTHTLHFLSQVNYIYTIMEGRIAERGTYAELSKNSGEFSRFIAQFRSQTEVEEKDEKDRDIDRTVDMDPDSERKRGGKKAIQGPALMQAEERNTGAVAWSVYREYLSAGRSNVVLPLLFFSLALTQATNIMSSYWYAGELFDFRPYTNFEHKVSLLGRKARV